jgi:integrase
MPEANNNMDCMASKITNKLIAYKSAYYMKPYRNVKIYPAILTKKRSFSEAEKNKLTAKGKRWYVYYDFINPKTGEFKRQTPITEGINRNFPEFDDRLIAIKELRQAVLELLKDGYNPYEEVVEDKQYRIADALYFAVETKKNDVKLRTYDRYKGTVRVLEKWLKKNGYANYDLKKANRKLLSEFLRHISQKSSNRTRNNYRGDLSALFSVLMQEDYISDNPAAKIKNLPTTEKRDPTYSDEQVKEILEYLEKNDILMHLFILMVSYMFWRPIELTRIQVKDINLKERLISEQTKTKGLKTKLIPQVLFPYLEEYLIGANPEDYLFTPTGPGTWETKNKRFYFTRRYAAIKKELGLDSHYTIYSFRHTMITKLYKNILSEVGSEEKAKQIVGRITGHTSKALEFYLHYIDASLPEDYSEYLK